MGMIGSQTVWNTCESKFPGREGGGGCALWWTKRPCQRRAYFFKEMDVVCLSTLGLYSDYANPATGTEGDTMIYACTYGAVASCNSIRFFELNPRFDEVCPGQGAWMYNATNCASYGRDPARTVECST